MPLYQCDRMTPPCQ